MVSPYLPGAVGLSLLKSGACLLLPCRLQGFMLRLGTQLHCARARLVLRTQRVLGTRRAVCLVKPDMNDGLAVRVMTRSPDAALLAVRTGHMLSVPVDVKTGDVKALLGTHRPTGIQVYNWDYALCKHSIQSSLMRLVKICSSVRFLIVAS